MADPESGDTIPSSDAALTRANNFLAVCLHRLLAEDMGNIFFSPFSISTAMAMLMCGAKGVTESELKVALGHEYAGLKDVASAFHDQVSIFLKGSDHYTLNCASAMFTSKDYGVTENYKSTLAKYFNANLIEVDFTKESEKIVNTVNAWVKEKTNNMIPGLLNSVDPSTVLLLLNAIYFKGHWKRQFEKSSTYLQNFYNGGSKVFYKKINMMHLKETFPYAEADTHKALELPYRGDELTMLILLPKRMNGLEELESSLTPTFVEDAQKQLVRRKVNVALPRFSLEYSKSLVKSFAQLGVKAVFGSASDLGGISDRGELAVTDIFHKAVLVVNEEGTEAAAVTAIFAFGCAVTREPEFIVDHPFMFVIYDKRSNLVLFMGRVNKL